MAFACMRVLVNGELNFLAVFLPTRLAFERPFSRVARFVVFQCGQLSEAPATFFAFIWSFSSMYSFVDFQA